MVSVSSDYIFYPSTPTLKGYSVARNPSDPILPESITVTLDSQYTGVIAIEFPDLIYLDVMV